MAEFWKRRRKKTNCVIIIVKITAFIVSFTKNGQAESTTTTPITLPPTVSVNSTLSTSTNGSNDTRSSPTTTKIPTSAWPLAGCPDETPCIDLGSSCIQCEYNHSCVYGKDVKVKCKALDFVKCKGPRTFTKTFNCRYCYQTPKKSYTCIKKTLCKVISSKSAPPRYLTNCTVKEEVLCLGNRTFNKFLPCNWTSGYRWSTAVLLSLTLGGFGVDRFYLGHWKEGLGKLFSFGGLGVWTLVDLVLVVLGYIGPADGSLYIL